MSEAVVTDPFAYPSYNEFFTRALQPNLRPIANGLYDLVSPADGTISALGSFDQGTLLQAKGHTYKVEDLLGGNLELARIFQHGRFITIYLAPHNYHRVHMPFDGHLQQMIYIPGSLFSVNKTTAENIPNLFARNERIVAIFNTSQGRMAVILIGAMIVGSMETVWTGPFPPRPGREIKSFSYNNAIFLRRGEEMGRFKLGSTVIVLSESDQLNWDSDLSSGSMVKFGQALGIFKST